MQKALCKCVRETDDRFFHAAGIQYVMVKDSSIDERLHMSKIKTKTKGKSQRFGSVWMPLPIFNTKQPT